MGFSQILEDLYVGSYPESLEDIERLKNGYAVSSRSWSLDVICRYLLGWSDIY